MNSLWQGRYDGDEKDDLRLWQVIENFSSDIVPNKKSICFIGYNTDDGVRRNQGRIGAKAGSNAIRTAMQSFPNIERLGFYEYGNLKTWIVEDAQAEFSEKVADVIKANMFPIGLGGGHDIAFASFLGVRKAYPDAKIGIINFDTHLDMRPYDNGGTSGTSFKQILDLDKNVEYTNLGFKQQGNIERLIDYSKQYGVYVIDEEETEFDMESVARKLKERVDRVDIVYITVCCDVFDISSAPGVSAPTAMGLDPKKARILLKYLFSQGKVVCLDFAEVNPTYDLDTRTSKLVGSLIYDILLSM